MVRTEVPSACASGTREAHTGAPFDHTVHAPHSPSPQPPSCRELNSSRSTSSKRFIGCAVDVHLGAVT